MHKKLLSTLSILLLLFVGCSDDSSSPTETDDNSSSKNELSLSGSDTGSFESEVSYFNNSSSIGITISEKNGSSALVINSEEMTTGTFSIPDKFEAIYTDTENGLMYNFHSGTVKIDAISVTKISGSISGSAHPMSLMTFETDTTKTLNIDAKFEN